LTQHHLERIARLDPRLNSFITVAAEQALLAADAADASIKAGDAGPLTGIPIAHKDIFCTNGIKTSCGSRMLDNFTAPYDATVVEKLNQAGAVMLGKTNMDEFAMGSSNETSFYGPVRNPWDETASPAARPAARRRRSRHGSAPPPPAPTPAAPSASPRPFAASPASSPPTGAARAGA
jgi:aspartyl-tRNA(Asn)/glutamyl-tRNA(Gln) amidotransferase subunit A